MTPQERIVNAGLRPTKARIAVLSTIAEADSALSHPEILERLSGQKGFDRVTVYRVLDWLTEHDLVHKISGENRAWKFQLSQQHLRPLTTQSNIAFISSSNHPHAHLHCKICGKITCVHELEPHFPPQVLSQYQVTAIDINIKGVCADCASKLE